MRYAIAIVKEPPEPPTHLPRTGLCVKLNPLERGILKILVSNDDGIYARGMWLLAERLKQGAEVVVVAPDREQSGAGTAVSLHHPLRLHRMRPLVAGIETYSVEGTPSDSIILALGTVLKDGVDLVICGINEGANLGNDVLISGTVGAALQGFFHGIPSIALSVAAIKEARFEAAAELGVLLAHQVAEEAIPRDILLNVNLPNLPAQEIQGIELTRLAQRSYADVVREGHDGKRKYYWIVRGEPQWNIDAGTDIWAVTHGRISIAPLGSNLTQVAIPPHFGELLPRLWQELRRLGSQAPGKVDDAEGL
ncbi:MAG TPA: 5'/3'-nucleotidase SurE [Dehalococcoidia bacterium]|jgi:5'-nucleotidase|nr:5'/3'-nucleotidase SurE [Dehalococcoidia bacterium]